MNLAIYTEEYFAGGWLKNLIKAVLGNKTRGPQAVVRSLRLGLGDLKVDYKYNLPPTQGDVAGVVNGVKVLKWAIGQKKLGRIAKIIAGTNISILPSDNGGILQDLLIDAVLVPCLWVQKEYEKDAPELVGKIYVWPAGVDVPEIITAKKDTDFLIFNKQPDKALARGIEAILMDKKLTFKTITYGKFKQAEYFALLDKSKCMINIGSSESQGIAMFEAWARNVPTLVYGNHDPSGIKRSASPYLTDRCGMFFKDLDVFKNILPTFLQTAFSPRQYILDNFTHKKCAEKYLEIVKKVS